MPGWTSKARVAWNRRPKEQAVHERHQAGVRERHRVGVRPERGRAAHRLPDEDRIRHAPLEMQRQRRAGGERQPSDQHDERNALIHQEPQEFAEPAGLASPVVPQVQHDAIDGVIAHRLPHRSDDPAAVFTHDLVTDVERPLRCQVVEAELRLRVAEEVEPETFGQQQLPPADPVRVRLRVHGIDRNGAAIAVRHPDVEHHRADVVRDAQAGQDLRAREEDHARRSEVGWCVAWNDGIQSFEHRVDRDAVDLQHPSAFEVGVGLTGRRHVHPVRELPETDREPMDCVRVVGRPDAHVAVATVRADHGDQVHHPDQHLVVVQVGDRLDQLAGSSIEHRLGHAVEQIRVDVLHLFHQGRDVGRPPLDAGECGGRRTDRRRARRRDGCVRRRAGSGEEDEPGDDGNRSVPGAAIA